jgi:hypothetical protein
MTFAMSTCKSDNLHWNHFAQWDVCEFIFNEEVHKDNMNNIHIFTLAKLVEWQEWVKRLQICLP